MSNKINLKNFVPNIIKDQELWSDFLDTVSDEIQYFVEEIEKKAKLFEVELYDDIHELLKIARSLGYSPNLILREDITYVRHEVESIVFKIKSKASYAYYNYLFKMIPRKGTVYILFQDYLTLVRAIDWSTTFTNLYSHDITKPFTGVESILHYDTYLDKPVELDALILFYLDSLEKWYLDQDIVIKPTQHLSIEYQIDRLVQNEESEDVLLIADYLQYLSKGVEYGRKVTNVPHIGFSISMIMGEQGFFDTYSHDPNYTIPDLKLACSVTDGYKDSVPKELIYLDDSPQSDLDEEPYWNLDQEVEIVITKTLEERFKYVAIGTGSKNLFSIDYISLVTDLNIHLSFEDKETNVFKDNGINNYEAIAYGTFELQQGVSGKTVYYNGVDTELRVAGFVSSSSSKDINFWIIPEESGQVSTDPRFIFQDNYIDIFYNSSNHSIDCVITGDSGSVTMQSNTISENDFNSNIYFITIKIDSDNKESYMYINNTVQGSSYDLTPIGLYNSSNALYIGSKNGSNFFKGKIDELRVYGKILTDSDRQYLYDKRLGSLRYLDNEIYRKELSTNQIRSSSVGDWNAAAFTIPVNTVNNELIAYGDGTTKHFTGTLNYNNLYPGYLILKYYSFPNWYTALTNPKGEFVGEGIEGTINYVTGEYDFTTEKENKILIEFIAQTESKSTIDYGMDHNNIKPGSCHINYYISDTQFDILDDGSGNFDGGGYGDAGTTGTINYTTGHIVLTFSSATDSDSDIYIYYDYIKDTTPSSNSDIRAEYKLQNSLPITEMAIINDDNEVSMYSTFPKSEYDTIYNHMAFQVFVKKN